MRFALPVLLLLLSRAAATAQPFAFKMELDALNLYYGEQPCFAYQTGTLAYDGRYARANYLHPLYGLSGAVLTQDFPGDHRHHRGVFWTWHQLFADSLRVGDPWLCEGLRWEVKVEETQARRRRASLQAQVYWLADATAPEAAPDTLLREDLRIQIRQRSNNIRTIDFDVTLHALVPGIRIGGSEDAKGYGGFSVRLNTDTPLSFSNGEGSVQPQKTAVAAGGWVRAEGVFNALLPEQTAVVMMCEPEQLPQFQGWILRKANSMQNPAFPGRQPIAIPMDEPLRFRNRLLLHRGPLKDKKVARYYRRFLRKR